MKRRLRRWTATIAPFALLAAASPAGAQRAVQGGTVIIAPLTGRLAVPAGEAPARAFSVDLGLTALHEGELRIVFGDAIWSDDGGPIDPERDDIQGTIATDLLPDGAAVRAYAEAHPAARGAPSWWRALPAVAYRLEAERRPAALTVHAGGATGALLQSGLFKAPIAAFSNARSGGESGFFLIYALSIPATCTAGACESGLACEARLGKLGGDAFADAPPCLLGVRDCLPVAGGGLCVDPTSSVYDPDSAAGLLQAVAWQHAVGNADRARHDRYFTRAWTTHKFTNLTARTVRDFDASRAPGEGDDYRPADGAEASAAKVFIWGRPSYIGTQVDGRDLALYFAVADVPAYSASGEVAWSPIYFSGLERDGRPRFSPLQSDAVPLELGGGVRPGAEVHDVVNQMSISWVEPLSRWVMLYGGGSNAGQDERFTSGLGSLVQPDPEGAIRIRFARQPWGPWSSPQLLFAAGAPGPLDAPPAAGTQYAEGGVLRHPACRSAGCAPAEPTGDPNDYGFLYGVNIIDPWTEATAAGARIFWNVSTWHPYQVLLMSSELERGADERDAGAYPNADAGQGAPVIGGASCGCDIAGARAIQHGYLSIGALIAMIGWRRRDRLRRAAVYL